LVKRLGRGDQTALAEIFDRTRSLVFGVVLRIVGDWGVAEEVTLDVYLQVWRSSATYDAQRGGPLGWLAMLARCRAIDRLRSGVTRQRKEAPLVDFPGLTAPDNPQDDAEAHQRRRMVWAALSGLPREQREVIELAYFSGMTQSELARHLRLPLGTVKTRMRLAMRKLRERLS
jgi:RNA polymerase sigma-70 factor (ECF subfamily)